MSAPLTGGLAPGLVLSGGYVLRVTALDPATGAVIPDVIVSDVSLQVNTLEAAPDEASFAILDPLLTYGPGAA